MKVNGKCLCESVKFSFDVKEKHFDACHCGMCRKWTGGPAMMVASAGELRFESEESIGVYSSSEWAERGFCKTCGTNLFYRLKEGNFICFPLGTLDEADSFTFTTEIFIDHKPETYSFADKTKKMTEAEVLAAFSQES